MNICSWNMYWYNQTPHKAFDFIRASEADILCLQEVPPEFLARLRTLPYRLVEGIEIERHFPYDPSERNHIVILSRYPVRAFMRVAFPDRISLPPLQARILAAFLRSFGWTPKATNRGFIYADIDTPQGAVRVFSVHLSLSSPTERRRELELVREHFPRASAALVCGDFNIIENSFMKTFNWFLGAKLSESVPWHRERTHAERRFRELRLKNPLRRKVTHRISQSQLDHILVPEAWRVADARVSRKKYGSDHRPVFVQIGLPSASGQPG